MVFDGMIISKLPIGVLPFPAMAIRRFIGFMVSNLIFGKLDVTMSPPAI